MNACPETNFGPDLPPLNLPVAIVTISEMGVVSVSVDGVSFDLPDQAGAWSRARFGELLDSLTLGRTRTVRIEVRESDGSVFTDIIHAVRPKAVVDEPPPAENTLRRARHRPVNQLVEISGSGFIPGEDVTVALGVSSAEGSVDGHARGLIDLNHLIDHHTEVMLIGRISGVIISQGLPS